MAELDPGDHGAVVDFCATRAVDLVVVGPEAPLVEGLADRLSAEGIAVFGPSRAAARLEGSKGFTKDLCERAGIPTAPFACFDGPDAAKGYVRERGAPIVVKLSGIDRSTHTLDYVNCWGPGNCVVNNTCTGAKPHRPSTASDVWERSEKPDLRIREGMKLVDQSGYFKVTDDRITFYPEDKQRLTVLENLALERIGRVTNDRLRQQQWRVTGTITEYRGRNYILVIKAIRKRMVQ